MPRERRRKAKKDTKPKKEKGPFRYTRGGPDPYHSMLNFLQTQAHNNQVESLMKQLGQAQAHARSARQEAFEEAYANVRPMDEDPPTPRQHPENMEADPPTPRRSRNTPDDFRAGRVRIHTSRTQTPSAAVHSSGTQTEAGHEIGTQTTTPASRSHRTQTDRAPEIGTQTSRPLTEDVASHIAHTVEPAVAREVFRFAASGEAERVPKRVEYSHEAFFSHRMNRLHGAEHGGIPTPEGISAYQQALLEMRSKDDAARSGFLPFNRVTTGYDYRPLGRDFKAARVNDPSVGANPQATYDSYLADRLKPRE